jgi:hypothetical protein
VSEPPVPASVRDGDCWELIEADTRPLADATLVTVTATRSLYGDRCLRERVREGTGIDRLWRAFFASELVTDPPLSPRIADLVVQTIARPAAARRFAADLRERGFEAVQRRDDREVDLGDGRARAVRFGARVPVDGGPAVAVDAWLAVWERGERMRVAGGIYPVEPLRVDGGEDLFAPPGEYRTELLDLIRTV